MNGKMHGTWGSAPATVWHLSSIRGEDKNVSYFFYIPNTLPLGIGHSAPQMPHLPFPAIA